MESFAFPLGLQRVPLSAVKASRSFRDHCATETDAPDVNALVVSLQELGWQVYDPMRAVVVAARDCDALSGDITVEELQQRLRDGTVRF